MGAKLECLMHLKDSYATTRFHDQSAAWALDNAQQKRFIDQD